MGGFEILGENEMKLVYISVIFHLGSTDSKTH